MEDYQEGNFALGIIWGISLSIPLWISLFGWAKLVLQLVNYYILR
ncbi:hypothetical protein [Alkalihalobacillus sp. R86527]